MRFLGNLTFICRYTSSQKLPQHTHNPQGRKERVFGFRNPVERRTYEELMLGVKGKGKGKRGRVSKKGGSKVDVDEVMELGYGHAPSSDVRWTGISRYLPIVPRIPLDWDTKIKAKTDDANLERDEEHLGRFLKQSTVVTKSGAWEVGVEEVQVGLGNHGVVAMFLFLYYPMEES